MWHLGQTVKRIDNNELYLYLGVRMAFQQLPLPLVLVNELGEVVHDKAGKHMVNTYTHIVDSNGETLPGKYAVGDFFGVLIFVEGMIPDMSLKGYT
jgi:hypothetical protein